MEFTVHHDSDAEVLLIQTHGPATLDGFKSYLIATLDHPAWQPRLRILVDHRDLNLAAMSSEDINALATFHRSHAPDFHYNPIASVVGRMVDYGLARMWEAFMTDSGLKHRVFTDLTEARAWLLQPPLHS